MVDQISAGGGAWAEISVRSRAKLVAPFDQGAWSAVLGPWNPFEQGIDSSPTQLLSIVSCSTRKASQRLWVAVEPMVQPLSSRKPCQQLHVTVKYKLWPCLSREIEHCQGSLGTKSIVLPTCRAHLTDCWAQPEALPRDRVTCPASDNGQLQSIACGHTWPGNLDSNATQPWSTVSNPV